MYEGGRGVELNMDKAIKCIAFLPRILMLEANGNTPLSIAGERVFPMTEVVR